MIQGHPGKVRHAIAKSLYLKVFTHFAVSRETFTHNLWWALITGVLPGF